MKTFRFFLAILTATVLCLLTPLSVAAQAETVYQLPDTMKLNAASALVVSLGNDPADDVFLGGKQIDAPRSPAALVRLMVGAYAATLIEEKNIDIDKATGTYTYECFNLIAGSGVATVQMKIGETWTVRDLLTISMMQTAGDAVVTLAMTLSESHNSFVAGMNELAKKIGCENTHFVNVTGLDATGQTTTARDLYRIMRYAMDFPELRAMMGKIQHTVKPVKGGNETVWTTVNYLLRTSSSSYYAPTEFGRTGYTDDAGRCVAAVAMSDGYECMAIVLGCPPKDENGTTNLQFVDAKTLFKWSFSNFSYKTVLAKGEILDKFPVEQSMASDTVSLCAARDVSIVVPNDLQANTIKKVLVMNNGEDGTPITAVVAPVKKGTVLGKVELYISMDVKIGEVELVAGESMERSGFLATWDTLVKVVSSPWLYAALGAIVVCIIIYVVALVARNRSRYRGKKMKKSKRTFTRRSR